MLAMARTSNTIGFSVTPKDLPRLDHLTLVFGGGNRAEFLRRALDVMEDLELNAVLEELNQTRDYGADRLDEEGLSAEDLPRIVDEALSDPDPAALAKAKLVVASMAGRRTRTPIEDAVPSPEFLAVYRKALAET